MGTGSNGKRRVGEVSGGEAKKREGFSVTLANGKSYTVYIAGENSLYVNGRHENGGREKYEQLLNGSKEKNNFKKLSSDYFENLDKENEIRRTTDYELGLGKYAFGTRGKGKTVYRPRRQK